MNFNLADFEALTSKMVFPQEFSTSADPGYIARSYGLTKRELAAMVAMQGLLAFREDMTFNEVTDKAVTCADLLIERLKK